MQFAKIPTLAPYKSQDLSDKSKEENESQGSFDEILHRISALLPDQSSPIERRFHVDRAKAEVENVPILVFRPLHKWVCALPDQLVFASKQNSKFARRVMIFPVANGRIAHIRTRWNSISLFQIKLIVVKRQRSSEKLRQVMV